jgi:hypothetical protein
MAKQPTGNRTASGNGVLAVAAALAAAAFFGLRATASPAPFGAAVMRPQPQFTTEGVAFDKTDWLAKRVPPAYLEFLAPQPDGTPPLRYPYKCDRGGFTIRHPMGAELTQLAPEQFFQQSIDAIVDIHYDQPLQRIRYQFPVRHAGETVEQFIARMRYELERMGATFPADAPKRLELPRYRFERLEFVSAPQSGAGRAAEQHFWFVGPLGSRVALIDFSAAPANAVLARRQAEKVMGSFSPSFDLGLVMLEEDPQYGEWGGTANVGLAQQRKREREAAQAAADGAQRSTPAPPRTK